MCCLQLCPVAQITPFHPVRINIVDTCIDAAVLHRLPEPCQIGFFKRQIVEGVEENGNAQQQERADDGQTL